MTRRFALVDTGGLVVNLIEWDGEAAWSPPEGLQVIEAEAPVGIGWLRQDGAWLEPEGL